MCLAIVHSLHFDNVHMSRESFTTLDEILHGDTNILWKCIERNLGYI